MHSSAGETVDGPPTPDAVGAFTESLGKIEAIVREKLGIDLVSSIPRSDRRGDGGYPDPEPLNAFVQDLQSSYGGTLLAVYRLGLFDALAEETSFIAAELAARGAPRGFVGNMLNAWIFAIHGSVPAPQARALVSPLERVKRGAQGTEPLRGAGSVLPRVSAAVAAGEAPAGERVPAPFLASLLGRNPVEAEKRLLELLASGVTLERICVETIFPAMREMGALWQRNELTVSEEHAATAKLRRAVHVLFGRVEGEPRRLLGVVVTCAPGDEHELGAEIYALYLETKGWPVLFLGHGAPMSDVLLAVGGSRPFGLVISATLIAHLPAAVDLAARARERVPGVKIVFGGRAATRAERALRGFADAVARTPEGCHAAIENMALNANAGESV